MDKGINELRWLEGKSILLLAPQFFGYENAIKRKIESFGGNVKYINDNPTPMISTLISAFNCIEDISTFLKHRFENRVLKDIGSDKYDLIIVICGFSITSRIMEVIRRTSLKSNGKMVLYYWDSLRLLNDDIKRHEFFDSISTFDKKDYEKNKNTFHFLPLFYCDEYRNNNTHVGGKWDLYTVGSFKYNRYFDIQRLIDMNPNIKIKYDMYANRQIIVVHKVLRKKYRGIDLRKLTYKSISRDQIKENYNNSKAVLDIPKAGQNGLTIRTLECLAMKKKIVTTNTSIREYDFYNSDNIYVLDEKNPILPPEEWFQSEYVDIDERILDRYSLESWLTNLLKR